MKEDHAVLSFLYFQMSHLLPMGGLNEKNILHKLGLFFEASLNIPNCGLLRYRLEESLQVRAEVVLISCFYMFLV